MIKKQQAQSRDGILGALAHFGRAQGLAAGR